METIILALAITLVVVTIASIANPKLRAAVYTLPIPITIVLIGTGGNVNTTHLTGLMDVIIFFSVIWFLSEKLKLHIVWSICSSILIYIFLGIMFKKLIEVPFMFSYVTMAVVWLIYIFRLQLRVDKSQYRQLVQKTTYKDHIARAGVVFSLASIIITIKSLLLGATVTFPYTGTFTAYVMRNQLPVLIAEICRNFFAIMTFFLVVWYLQPKIGLLSAIAIGWIVNISVLYMIVRYLPRR